MITLNGKMFAKNDKEFTDSLFQEKGTCVGKYKVLKNKVNLYDIQNNIIGVVTKTGVLAKATKATNKRYWYSYSAVDLIGEYASIGKQDEDIRQVLALLGD